MLGQSANQGLRVPPGTSPSRAQEEHHKKWSFEQEFLTLVRKAGIEPDPEHLFG